jgi:hypothetical protein
MVKMVRTYSWYLGGSILLSLQSLIFLNHPSKQSTFPVGPVTKKTQGSSLRGHATTQRKSSVSFVFFVGLEGTGHHFIHTLISSSPDVARLEELNIQQDYTGKLQQHLFNNQEQNGLWNAHCNDNPEKVNVTESHDKVVQYLSKINERANGEEIITFPVNTILRRGAGYGMVSYPNFEGSCRSLNYPNLDHFYRACDVAGVECKHAYVYRDPYSVLASTTLKRKMNKGPTLKAIHLYTSLLQIIRSQLLDHSDRTLACLGFYEPKISADEVWNPIRDMFGWKNQTEFDAHVQAVYKPPSVLTKKDRHDLVPPNLELYMESYVRAHDNVVKLCREQTDI